jgi:hypothetical protein
MQPGKAVHACNPSPEETEAGGLEFEGCYIIRSKENFP